MKKKTIIAIGIILLVLVLDQLVKVWVKTSFFVGETRPFIPNVLQLSFIENRGMAFGTTLGNGVWGKYILSIFRFAAIIGIAIYIRRLILDPKAKMFFLITIALIFAGAAGNLIDGMFYDGIFGVDPEIRSNWVLNEFHMPIYDANGEIVIREGGFLLGSVVDMFQFTFKWPSWAPEGYAGTDVFPFIFNVADASISLGVVFIFLKYRSLFFTKKKEQQPIESD